MNVAHFGNPVDFNLINLDVMLSVGFLPVASSGGAANALVRGFYDFGSMMADRSGVN
jgi:hypothetical protein